MENYLQQVKKAKQGDTEAFASLYQEIYPDLYRFALYTLRDKNDAEDAVSETVVDAFAAISTLRLEEAFRSWMFRILSNKCKNRLREYARKTVELSDELKDEVPEKKKGQGMDEDILVRQLFFSLDEEERLIISMHLFAGYTSREMAELLHMNENTIRSRESRALKKLAKKLEMPQKNDKWEGIV